MVDWMQELESLGVGAISFGLGELDKKAATPRTQAFKNAQDIGNAAMHVGGLAMQMFMPRAGKHAQAITLASGSLLAISVGNAIMEWSSSTGTSRSTSSRGTREYTARKTATRSYQPEFENVRAF